jgi:hypothetical protein
MYSMRHPLCRITATEAEFTGSKDIPATGAHASASPITPSVPGLAFAVVAAALPLLRGNNVETSFGKLITN